MAIILHRVSVAIPDGVFIVRNEARIVRDEKCMVRVGECIVRDEKCIVRVGARIVRDEKCIVRVGECIVRDEKCIVRVGYVAVWCGFERVYGSSNKDNNVCYSDLYKTKLNDCIKQRVFDIKFC